MEEGLTRTVIQVESLLPGPALSREPGQRGPGCGDSPKCGNFEP